MCNTLAPFSIGNISVADCIPLSILYCRLLQELSYRKHIARQLRTQNVEGIYSNPVTLKSRLRVTQGN